METHADRPGRAARHVCFVALLLLVWSAWPARAPAQDDPDDQPRRDLRLGNTENMRSGRNAQGDTVMEVRRPPKDPANQPPVGPFFIYPQVGTPPGPPRNQGDQSKSSSQAPVSGAQSQTTGQAPGSGATQPAAPGKTGPTGQVGNTVIYRPGEAGQVGNTVIYQPGQSGQVGNTVIYNPGQPGPPAGPGKGAGS